MVLSLFNQMGRPSLFKNISLGITVVAESISPWANSRFHYLTEAIIWLISVWYRPASEALHVVRGADWTTARKCLGFEEHFCENERIRDGEEILRAAYLLSATCSKWCLHLDRSLPWKGYFRIPRLSANKNALGEQALKLSIELPPSSWS